MSHWKQIVEGRHWARDDGATVRLPRRGVDWIGSGPRGERIEFKTRDREPVTRNWAMMKVDSLFPPTTPRELRYPLDNDGGPAPSMEDVLDHYDLDAGKIALARAKRRARPGRRREVRRLERLERLIYG